MKCTQLTLENILVYHTNYSIEAKATAAFGSREDFSGGSFFSPFFSAGPRSFGGMLNVENPIMTRMMNACHSHIPISSGFRIQVALAVKTAHRPSEM